MLHNNQFFKLVYELVIFRVLWRVNNIRFRFDLEKKTKDKIVCASNNGTTVSRMCVYFRFFFLAARLLDDIKLMTSRTRRRTCWNDWTLASASATMRRQRRASAWWIIEMIRGNEGVGPIEWPQLVAPAPQGVVDDGTKRRQQTTTANIRPIRESWR